MKCQHCGYDTCIQPPKETGCNHVYYPEACEVCDDREELKRENITISKKEYEELLSYYID